MLESSKDKHLFERVIFWYYNMFTIDQFNASLHLKDHVTLNNGVMAAENSALFYILKGTYYAPFYKMYIGLGCPQNVSVKFQTKMPQR